MRRSESISRWNSSCRRRTAVKTTPTSITASTCQPNTDRKSTRLNSSHLGISYAVFCLKKKSIKFVENLFIGPLAHLTPRDAAQPDLLDFFDFAGAPWSAPPSPPTPVTAESLGRDPCTPTNLGP